MEKATLWKCRVRKPGDEGWPLGWKMTKEQAREPGEKNSYEMQRAPGSAHEATRSPKPGE